jgi:predicted negative regulator of RcsB-dependent stress response
MAPLKKTGTIKRKTSTKKPVKKENKLKNVAKKAAIGLTGLAALGTVGYLGYKAIQNKNIEQQKKQADELHKIARNVHNDTK